MPEFVTDETPGVSWLPTTAAVAREVRTRVLARVGEQAAQQYIGYVDGTEAVDFTEDTRPNAVDVSASIVEAAAEAQAITGEPAPKALAKLAHNLTKFRVAADIEASYFSRQTGQNTANEYLTERADAIHEQLQKLADDLAASNKPGPADGAGGTMSSAFAPSRLTVIGCDGWPRPRVL